VSEWARKRLSEWRAMQFFVDSCHCVNSADASCLQFVVLGTASTSCADGRTEGRVDIHSCSASVLKGCTGQVGIAKAVSPVRKHLSTHMLALSELYCWATVVE
jgi:hypothetical protein